MGGQEAQRGRCSLAEERSSQGKLGSGVRGCNLGALTCAIAQLWHIRLAPRSPEVGSGFQEQGSVTFPTLEAWACSRSPLLTQLRRSGQHKPGV